MLSRLSSSSFRFSGTFCRFRHACIPTRATRQQVIGAGLQQERCQLSTWSKSKTFGSLQLKGLATRLVQSIRHTSTAGGSSAAQAAVRAYPDISEHAQKVVGRWLLACAGMVFGAVALGGATRLTESGLSITKWDPITGIKPPLSEAEWEIEFEKYKQFPEYKFLERELSMSDFKFIYFMEWFHRIWGRMVGVTFLLPAVYFWRKGYLAKAMKPRMFIYGGLIAFQGVLGIFMVNSGLKDQPESHQMPRVSQYRLCAHFGTAVILYAGMLWSALNHLLPHNKLQWTPQVARLGRMAHVSMSLVFLTALSGAFVAGLDAGLVYNSWPKFADRWIPSDLFAHSPAWKNMFENHTMVQFNHRHLGELTGLFIIGLWLVSLRTPLPLRARMATHALATMSIIQITLGILTLLNYVPTDLAVSHQSGSLVLLSCALWMAHELRRFPK